MLKLIIRAMIKIPLEDYFDFEKMSLLWKVVPFTMVGYKRLSNAYNLACSAVRENLNGAFVECGTWKGGCAALLAYVANKEKQGRKTWLFDSFEGLPYPTKQDGSCALKWSCGNSSGELTSLTPGEKYLGDAERLLFSILKFNKENINICEGWFQEVIPKMKSQLGPIAILRLDADMYESTKVCLENFYENVISRGYIIIDDYGCKVWPGCKKAVNEFLAKNRLNLKLYKIDGDGIYFQKP